MIQGLQSLWLFMGCLYCVFKYVIPLKKIWDSMSSVYCLFIFSLLENHFPYQFTLACAILILAQEIISNMTIFINLNHFEGLRKGFLMITVLPNHQIISNWGLCSRLMSSLKPWKSYLIQKYRLVIVKMVWVSTKKLEESLHDLYRFSSPSMTMRF